MVFKVLLDQQIVIRVIFFGFAADEEDVLAARSVEGSAAASIRRPSGTTIESVLIEVRQFALSSGKGGGNCEELGAPWPILAGVN